jgi:DNA mismatch repair protein MutL
VDVNIHPTKAEVRFRDKDRVFRGVQRAIRRALLAYSPLPGMEQGSRWGWVTQPSTGSRSVDLSWDFAAEEPNGLSAGLPSQTGQPTSADSLTQAPLPGERVPLLRLLGQVGTAYLVAEGPDGLYLIDQHAAHERVLFEKLLAQLDDQHASQNLLQPISVELSPEEAGLVTEQLEVLARIGFRVEPFGRNAFLVRAIPAVLGDIDPAEALRVLVVDFEEDETPLQAEVEARVIARVCKRAAVKAGQVLSPEEQQQLLRDLESCQVPRTCPHGRPTMIHLSVDLLERQFGRRGAR